MSDIQSEKPADPFAPAAASGGGLTMITRLGDSFYINPEKRLPALDQGSVRAYAASALADVSQVTHYALICEPHLTPRMRYISSYATMNNTALVKMVEHGVFYWPPAKSERFVLIYEMPVGRPMMPEGEFTGLTMRPDLIMGPVLNSILPAIADLHDATIVHGNIRASTIYGVGSGTVERVILGDCLAVPTASNQHPMFLPVELGMSSPLGRAPHLPAVDIYALGVSLAMLVRTRDPMEGMSVDETIRHRLEIGSLAAYTGKDRISGNLVELLRGLLNDDPDMRWTVKEVMAWSDGQHISPKQGFKKPKAARPLIYDGERYFRPQFLAMDLGRNQAEASQLVETKALEQWISRSLEDSSVQKRLEEAAKVSEDMGHGPGYWDRLLSMVSMALDPEAPVRYKGLTFFPDGVGHCLTNAIVMRSDLQPYIDLINQQIMAFWVTAQAEGREDVGAVLTQFENCRAFLRQSNIAYGIERCLYFLNPDCPCLSEKLRGFYVRTPEDMLRAFERISTQPNRPELFFDRHSVAFLSVKDRKDVDGFLIELNSSDNYKKILGNIKTLATIQQRSRMERLPGVCKWVTEILDPVYARFHDRELRAKLKKKAASLIEGGDISKIVGLVTNAQTLAYDIDGYNQARQEYYDLSQEQSVLEKKMANPSMFGKSIGREVAALVSCVLSGLAIMFFIFMYLSKGSVF
ncbi:MAG: hypothetical protein JWO78_266 [Micavibrio sp.]|nr:hypothetical protein [Micavibrio sp.]